MPSTPDGLTLTPAPNATFTGMVPALVTLEQHGPAAVVTLRRPDVLNAFTHPMLAELERAVADAVDDRDVVGVVITGEGRGFCSGLDATTLASTTDAGSSARHIPEPDELPGLFSYLMEQPKPIIAAVNGVAGGGGFVLATKCDLRFASTEASFVTVFSRRGLIAEHGLTWLLPRLIGTGDALDLLWSSRKIDAAEAYRIGLVQRIVPADDLVDDAVRYITDLADTVSPASMRDTKRLAYRHLGIDRQQAFVEADEATWAALDRPDATEGVASLLERRPPSFERLGGVDTSVPT